MNKSTFTDQIGREITISFPPKRIISVVPSQTELLFDLGLDEEVIGITRFCIHPHSKFTSTTKVGGTKKLNLHKIRELQPDLIIANKEENDQAQIEELMVEFPLWISDIQDLDDALDMINQIGVLVDKQLNAEALTAQIHSAFKSITLPAQSLRIVYFIWKGPYMIAGNHTFINSVINFAGWENAFQLDRYPEITAEDIAKANPDIIFLSSEPYPFTEKHIEEFTRLCPDAKVILVDGELFSWYGSRLKHTANYLKELQMHVNQCRRDL